MINLEQIQACWRSVLSDAQVISPAGPFPVQEIRDVQLPTGYPLLAVDARGQRHLLLPAAQGTRIAKDQTSTGVQLIPADWREADTNVRVVDIVCLKPHLNDLFDLIIVDVLKGLAEDAGRPDAVGRRVLNRWRELLSRDPGQMPEKVKLIGLLGELMVLRSLSEAHSGALTCWTGPLGGRHDFSGRFAALEVKSTLQRLGLRLTISSVDQLLPPPDSELHLAVMRFEEAPYDGQGVADLVEDLVRFGIDNVALLERLANIGFSPDIITKTAGQKFRLLESRQYVVDSSFPRIIPTSFTAGALPNGVLALTYEIDLSATPPDPLSAAQAKQFIKDFITGQTS